MEPFFQHLQPETATGASQESRSQLGRLLDMERNTLGQGQPRVVTDAASGRNYLVPHTLPASQPDMESYDPNYASTLPVGSEASITARTSAVLNRIEDAQVGYASTMIQAGTTKRHTLHECLAMPVGVSRATPFTVSHAGGNRWLVTGGTFSWYEYDVPAEGDTELTASVAGSKVFKDTFLQTSEGFIGFTVPLAPIYDEESGHTRFGINGVSDFQAKRSYTNNSPTRLLPPPGDGETDPESATFVEWSTGSMFVPIAYVVAPSGGRPLILNVQGGWSFAVGPSYSGPGLPPIFPDLIS